MNYLYELGLTDRQIQDMSHVNTNLLTLSEKEIYEKIDFLRLLNCNDKTIKNIIITNPIYLSRSQSDVINLVKKLLLLDIEGLNITFENNPWLLNYDVDDIDEFIEKRKDNMSMDNILDMLESGVVE